MNTNVNPNFARTPSPAQDPVLTKLLDETRKTLIETGTRNRLVHTNRSAKRPATLTILEEDANELFDRLVNKGKKLRFRPDPAATDRERARSSKEDDSEAVTSVLSIPAAIPSGPDVLQTKLGETALQKRLLRFARESKALEDEQGINILYLAVGFLRWYEDEKSDVLREAPLVLIPVSLERDPRRSTFDLRAREDDMVTNLPLSERLRDQDGISLPDLPEGDDWLPNDYFDLIAEAIAGQPRWSIDRSGVELGFFSFAKLLMYHDLAPSAWTENAILAHPLLRGLMVDGFAGETDLFPEPTRIDDQFSPADLIHVVDADGSQALVIETVRRGRNLVVQGPPGTGKSQTITNIIASAAHDGKRVLFIAEKMVALEVVYERLKKVGLGNLCLELHSRAANKRAVALELGATLSANCPPPDISNATRQLTEARDQLNRDCAALHAPIGKTGATAYRAIGDLVRAKGKGLPPPSTPIPDITKWTPNDYTEAVAATAKLAEMTDKSGAGSRHPWRGVLNLDLQPNDLQRLEGKLGEATNKLSALVDLLNNAVTIVDAEAPSDLAAAIKLIGLIEILSRCPRVEQKLLQQVAPLPAPDRLRAMEVLSKSSEFIQRLNADGPAFVPAAIAADVLSVRTPLARGTSSFFYRWSGHYRRAIAELRTWVSSELPKAPNERLALADRLFALQEARRQFSLVETGGRAMFGAAWRAEATPFVELSQSLAWVDSVRAAGHEGSLAPSIAAARKDGLLSTLRASLAAKCEDLRSTLAELSDLLALDHKQAFGVENFEKVEISTIERRLSKWSSSLSRYDEWRRLVGADKQLQKLGLSALAERIRLGELPNGMAVEELRHARAEALWTAARKHNPALAAIDGAQRSDQVESFQKLDRDRGRLLAASIRSSHLSALPNGSMGQMAIIRGEVAKKRAHLPIRKLMGRAGHTVQKIKPIFLMSPISVAQFVPPGALEFDLLLIDEASQVRPEDALGVIARAKQVVVVGDVKQLPPTNFFSRLVIDDEDDGADDDASEPTALQGAARVSAMESILTLCEARGVSSKMLRWHYRSKHHSLIEISNAEFYRDLVLPPSPAAQHGEDGFIFRRVQGAYDRGGKRTNAVEAKAIVDALIAHATKSPTQSLGIVTFSSVQRDEITNQIDQARRTNEALDAFIRGQEHLDEVFIKSIENVQGDERDVILISVGYGPRIAGARIESMASGPIATEGGERRLNVLFTRARRRCEVFASFDPSDIDLSRARSEGARVFKRYLSYAQTGLLDEPLIGNADHDSPFEEEVADAIRKLGCQVDAQVGSAGFKIDLAVRHPEKPGRFMLAVECDGATYHGALWARERDRLRQTILEGMGWRFYRIWSTDWYYRRDSEIQRLRQALESAGAADAAPMPPTAELYGAPETVKIQSVDVAAPPPAALAKLRRPAYQLASFAVDHRSEPHLVPGHTMARIVGQIVELEGPIHKVEVARRVAQLFQKERAGNRIRDAVLKAGEHYIAHTKAMVADGDFWLTTAQLENPIVRDRSVSPLSIQQAANLPPTEAQAAILEVFAENGPMSREDIFIAVSRAFGFQRSGPEFKAVIDKQLTHFVARGLVVADREALKVVAPS